LLSRDEPWLAEFLSELLSFPGRHDDQVDALSQGLALEPRSMEGTTGSAKDDWTGRLNRHPGETIRDRICKQLI
jgi:hypothetical protein